MEKENIFQKDICGNFDKSSDLTSSTGFFNISLSCVVDFRFKISSLSSSKPSGSNYIPISSAASQSLTKSSFL